MEKIVEVVNSWAEAKWDDPPELRWSEDRKNASLKFSRSHDDIEYDIYLDIDEKSSSIGIFVYGPSPVPGSRLSQVNQAISLINPELKIGNVELVQRAKTWFRFREGINIEGGILSHRMIDNMLDGSLSVMGRFYPGLIGVMYACAEPVQAVYDALGKYVDLPSNIEKPADIGGPDSLSLRRWATEMDYALAGEAESRWDLIGHGAIVVHDDIDRAEKMIRQAASVGGMKCTVLDDTELLDIPIDKFDPFAAHAPILVYLKPGDWMADPDKADKDSLEALRNFRKRLAARMKEFDPAHPVVYVTAVKDLDHVCPFLKERKVFDRYFHVPSRTPEQIGRELISLFGENIDESVSLYPGKLGELLNDDFDTKRMMGLLFSEVERIRLRERRKVCFLDLVKIAVHGLGDTDEVARENPLSLRYSTVHEAGHAAIAMLDSDGGNVPEYSSIISKRQSGGNVVESMSYHFEKGSVFTHTDFVRNVRIALAGRAAEEVVFGRDGISCGSRSDLENCARIARKAFARYGFSADLMVSSSDNLAVATGDPSESEMKHVEEMMRQFLGREYGKVIDILQGHRPLLDEIAARLAERGVLDQGEIYGIYATHVKKAA